MNYTSNVVIHLNEKLDSQRRVNLFNKLEKFSGVISAYIQDERPQLMIVGNNPNEIKAYDVLSDLKKEGLEAQLVTWL